MLKYQSYLCQLNKILSPTKQGVAFSVWKNHLQLMLRNHIYFCQKNQNFVTDSEGLLFLCRKPSHDNPPFVLPCFCTLHPWLGYSIPLIKSQCEAQGMCTKELMKRTLLMCKISATIFMYVGTVFLSKRWIM